MCRSSASWSKLSDACVYVTAVTAAAQLLKQNVQPPLLQLVSKGAELQGLLIR